MPKKNKVSCTVACKKKYIMNKMPKTRVTINMTKETLKRLDAMVDRSLYTRSVYIEVAVKEKMKREKGE